MRGTSRSCIGTVGAASVAHAGRPSSLNLRLERRAVRVRDHERAGREVVAAQLERLLGRRHLHGRVREAERHQRVVGRVIDDDRAAVALIVPANSAFARHGVIGWSRIDLSSMRVHLDVAQQRDRPARVVVRPRVVRRIPLQPEEHLDDAAVRLVQADDVVAGLHLDVADRERLRRGVDVGALAADEVHQLGGFDSAAAPRGRRRRRARASCRARSCSCSSRSSSRGSSPCSSRRCSAR